MLKSNEIQKNYHSSKLLIYRQFFCFTEMISLHFNSHKKTVFFILSLLVIDTLLHLLFLFLPSQKIGGTHSLHEISKRFHSLFCIFEFSMDYPYIHRIVFFSWIFFMWIFKSLWTERCQSVECTKSKRMIKTYPDPHTNTDTKNCWFYTVRFTWIMFMPLAQTCRIVTTALTLNSILAGSFFYIHFFFENWKKKTFFAKFM